MTDGTDSLAPAAPLRRGAHHRPLALLDRLFEKALALTLLLLATPFFLLLPILIKLQDGGPVFYRSRRLGKDQRPFVMYKFRTLVPDAEARVGGNLLRHSQHLETPIGRFLREVRLDELPQLVNVLKGDMEFFGPRPERPAVYEAQCRGIPGYDQRFRVRPGLVGYAQLFTPHSAPKRLRALIDNHYARHTRHLGHDLALVLLACGWLLWVALTRLGRGAWLYLVMTRRFGQAIERRTLERFRPRGVTLAMGEGVRCVLGDINEEYLLAYTDRRLDEGTLPIRLTIDTRRPFSRRHKHKVVRATGGVYRWRAVDCHGLRFACVIRYQASSPLNRYLIDKYLTHLSIL